MNKTFRTPYTHHLLHVSAVFGHHQVHFTTI